MVACFRKMLQTGWDAGAPCCVTATLQLQVLEHHKVWTCSEFLGPRGREAASFPAGLNQEDLGSEAAEMGKW
jgi:hypothetical protein